MIDHKNKINSYHRTYRGKGLLNSAINKLPFELHLPGYNFCGPGTKLRKRLERGDNGINSLDEACKEHDIAYSKYKNLNDRHIADKILEGKAWERATSSKSTLGERINAWLVTNAMKTKLKLGMGLKRKKLKVRKMKCKKKNGKQLFKKTAQSVKSVLTKSKHENMADTINLALKTAKNVVKGKKTLVEVPRVIPVPKVGGILPLLPIFAGLSAIGALAGGASQIAKVVNQAKSAKEQLAENMRHNRQIEAIAIGKGLHLKPYKKGMGLYLTPQPKNF